jgi:hypothetical protein
MNRLTPTILLLNLVVLYGQMRGKMDKGQAYVQPESEKSYMQQAADKIRDTFEGSHTSPASTGTHSHGLGTHSQGLGTQPQGLGTHSQGLGREQPLYHTGDPTTTSTATHQPMTSGIGRNTTNEDKGIMEKTKEMFTGSGGTRTTH